MSKAKVAQLASVSTRINNDKLEYLYDFLKQMDYKCNPLRKLMKGGNKKLPKTTAIFNMSSATDCVSLKKNLCKACVYSKGKEKNILSKIQE